VVEALAVGHRRRGHEVAVALVRFDDTKHPLVDALLRDGVGVFEARVKPRAYGAERRAIRDVCRSYSPDVVHTHGYRTDVVDRGVAARLGIPTCTTVHGPSMNGGWLGAIYELIQRMNYRRFDAVVAVSAALREITLADGVRSERVHLIPNAWGGLHTLLPRAEARRQLGLEPAARVIGWVGRMIPVKGGDILLDALARLPEPRPTVAMIGHGIEAEPLAGRARQLGLGDAVRFYPDVLDAARFFCAFDAFALSSRSEGLPLVLLEAMAARVPIVAARVGGVPEALSAEEGLLVPAEDPDALAAALQLCLEDREGAEERAEKAARRLDSDFAFEPWLERYEDVYAGLMRRGLPAVRGAESGAVSNGHPMPGAPRRDFANR
jgi:glycosyltransferase involved in cell wall biosynthesis